MTDSDREAPAEGWLPPQTPPARIPSTGGYLPPPGSYQPPMGGHLPSGGGYGPRPPGYGPGEQPGMPHNPRRVGLILVAALVGASLLLAVAVAVPAYLALSREDARPTAADLSEVTVFEDLRTDHIDGPIDYEIAPPPGGPHHRFWLECGAYDRPVPTEFLVHSLEHGTVFIAHAPGLAADEVARLRDLLPEDGILAPYPGMDADIVVTVWGRQLALEEASDPRLPLFIEVFGDGHTAPEPGASCRGGVTPERGAALLGSIEA